MEKQKKQKMAGEDRIFLIIGIIFAVVLAIAIAAMVIATVA